MADPTFLEVEQSARKVVESGGLIFQTWACGGCHKRVTANKPNTLTVKGHCEDCDHVTDLLVAGCNFTAVLKIGGE